MNLVGVDQHKLSRRQMDPGDIQEEIQFPIHYGKDLHFPVPVLVPIIVPVLSFKKVDLQKKKIDWFDRQVLLFRKNEGIFLVDSKDFPEVVETMMKLYLE